MKCEHKRLQSINCVISCADCGEILPIDYLVGRERIKAQNAAEAAEKPAETAEPVKRGRKKVK